MLFCPIKPRKWHITLVQGWGSSAKTHRNRVSQYHLPQEWRNEAFYQTFDSTRQPVPCTNLKGVQTTGNRSVTGKKTTQPKSVLPGNHFYRTTFWAGCKGDLVSWELGPLVRSGWGARLDLHVSESAKAPPYSEIQEVSRGPWFDSNIWVESPDSQTFCPIISTCVCLKQKS